MKTLYALLTFTMLFMNHSLFGQDTSTSNTALLIKTDIAMPLIGLAADFKAGSVTVEVGINHRHSFQLTGLTSTLTSSNEKQDRSKQIIGMYKYFLSSKKDYSGFYTGLYVKGAKSRHVIDQRNAAINYYLEYNKSGLYSGLSFGYQTYFKKRIVVDLVMGIGVGGTLNTKMIKSENVLDFAATKSPFDGIFAVNIGYKF